ncbi:MAG: DNA-binding protein [Sphingomonadales bacterium 32-68-7]|nr:MAG: DNA-binding protein [Sphingomonadales bacterium 12-68-11]OYX07425.1 MAG: DNA-binding protein [Sphingomonadales bacterium 32-68-7]
MSQAPNVPELSRLVDLRQVVDGPQDIVATAEERAALARRFALVAIDRLEARVTLAVGTDGVDAKGRLGADIVQSCAVSGEDLPVTIDEPIRLRFVPEQSIDAEELDLEAGQLDEIEYSGTGFDLGEAVAQSLALAIDPYAVGQNAERARREAGFGDPPASGPFAALAALKKG